MKRTYRLRIALLILSLLALAAASARSRQLIADPNDPDTIVVGTWAASVEVGHTQIPIDFVNDEVVAGMEIVLTWDSPGLTIDSFSFDGGRAQGVDTKGASYGGNYVIIFCFPFGSEELIQPGAGNLGNLFFSYSTAIDPQTVTIDTTTIIVGDLWHYTVFSDVDIAEFYPQFVAGTLDITPGCCNGIRGNIDGNLGDNIDIADLTYLVEYLFNGGPTPICVVEADLDASGGMDISDLTYLVEYLFGGGPVPLSCN